MANDVSENMVLRTIYLPPELDTRLKWMAIRHQLSKNELMRELIELGLKVRDKVAKEVNSQDAGIDNDVSTDPSGGYFVRVKLRPDKRLALTPNRPKKRTLPPAASLVPAK